MTLFHPTLAFQVIRPASLYMMHEHINYYTENALNTLMRECGGTVIASGSYPLSATAGNADVAWCLGSNGR